MAATCRRRIKGERVSKYPHQQEQIIRKWFHIRNYIFQSENLIVVNCILRFLFLFCLFILIKWSV